MLAIDTDLWADATWIVDSTPLSLDRPGLLIIANKGYVSGKLDIYLTERGVQQLIRSVNDTLKGQLDLELHGGRTIDGVTARIAQRVLALTAAICRVRSRPYSASCASIRSRSRTQKPWCSKVSLSTVPRHCRTERPRA